MARLRKSDVERLAAAYDTDPVGALCEALAVLTGRGTTDWEQMIGMCDLAKPRRTALLAREQTALDGLLRDLIELRELPPVAPTGRDDDPT